MHRRVWLLVAAFAALSLALGTGGFSAATMDRGVHVSVADHEHAFVGLADPGAHGTHPSPSWIHGKDNRLMSESPLQQGEGLTRLVVVKNRFGRTSLDVHARGTDSGDVRLTWSSNTTLHPHDVGVVKGTVDCEGETGPQKLDLTVTAEAVDGSLTASIDYPVTVVCASEASTPTPTATPAPE
jgi:hypothetical protein